MQVAQGIEVHRCRIMQREVAGGAAATEVLDVRVGTTGGAFLEHQPGRVFRVIGQISAVQALGFQGATDIATETVIADAA